MIRLGILFLVLGMVAGFGIWHITQRESGLGEIVAHDITLPSAPRGVETVGNLIVKSASDQPFRITQLGSTCGCVVTAPLGMTILAGEIFSIPFHVSNLHVHRQGYSKVFGRIVYEDGTELSNVLFGRIHFEVLDDLYFELISVSDLSTLQPGMILEFACNMDDRWLAGLKADSIAVSVSSDFGEYQVEWFDEGKPNAHNRSFSVGLLLSAQYHQLSDNLRIRFDLGPEKGIYAPVVAINPESGIVLHPAPITKQDSEQRIAVARHSRTPARVTATEQLGEILIPVVEGDEFYVERTLVTDQGLITFMINPGRVSGFRPAQRASLGFTFPQNGVSE